MVITLALAVCGLFLWGRKLSSGVLEFGKATLLNQQRCDSFDKKMEERLTDNKKHLFISVSAPIASLFKRIDKTDQAVQAIEKAMANDKKARYREDAEIAALNFSDYRINRVLSMDVGPSTPVDIVHFKKGDFIRTVGKDKRYKYWKCIVADSDSAVFGEVLYHRVTQPGKCSVSWADIFITHSVASLIGHRVDSLPDIG